MEDLKFKYVIQLFDDPVDPEPEPEEDSGITITTDIAPAISVDLINRLGLGIKKLMEVLGITYLTPVSEGSVIKRYQWVKATNPEQVEEGEVIPLTKYQREALDDVTIILGKYRALTTAEAIQRSGYERAINERDARLVKEVQGDVKKGFFATLNNGSGSATAGANLQKACANLWAALAAKYEDEEVSPVFFINPLDIAEYLGESSIISQDAFGLQYLQNFLGMGTAIISAKVTQGAPVATVAENLNGFYVPANGDLANAFGLTFDDTGMVGLTHYVAADNASIGSLLLSGVAFVAEEDDGIFVGEIDAD